MKIKIISIILFIMLAVTTTAIATDIKPFQITVSDWASLQETDKTNCCLYYLFELYKQGRLKKWVRRDLLKKTYAIYMAKKLSELISITIIKKQYTKNNIFQIALGEIVIRGWL